MEKPDEKDFTGYGSSRQYIKALEKYIKYSEAEKRLLESCINLNNPIDAKLKTDFKIFVNKANGNIIYSIFDDKIIMRGISSIEKFIDTLKILLKEWDLKTKDNE